MSFLINGIASIFGGARSNDIYDKALGNYADAQQKITGLYQPYADAGTAAVGRLTNMETPGFQYSPTDPSYAWRFDQGQQAVDQSAASKGQLFSGGTLKALTNYGQGAASTEFQNDFNRNAVLAGYGLTAANGDSSAYTNIANGRASVYDKKAGDQGSLFGGGGGGGAGGGGGIGGLISTLGSTLGWWG